MDFETSLRRAIKSGTVLIGQNITRKSVEDGSARMVVLATNCPEDFVQFLNTKEIFAYRYEGSGVQLGKTCGKPFMVSTLAIVDPGESDILGLMRA